MLFLERWRPNTRQQLVAPLGQTTVVDPFCGTTTVVRGGGGLRSTLMQDARGMIRLSSKSDARMEPPLGNCLCPTRDRDRGSGTRVTKVMADLGQYRGASRNASREFRFLSSRGCKAP
jgi:hypothetical protein